MQSGVLECSQVFWMSDIATSLFLSVSKWCVLSREFIDASNLFQEGSLLC